MDEELERIEKNISSLYSNAAKEVNAQLVKFTESYEKQLGAMQDKLDAGEISQSEYSLWASKQMLQTDRYKATVDSMTNILTRSDKAAMAVINGELPKVVAESYNFGQALGWKYADDAGMSIGTFQVYNAESVQKIIKDNPNLLKEVDVPEDEKWNKTHINREITTGIIKGESIPKIADRLNRVTGMDKNAATRNARTSMTYAENLGRMESADDLHKKGIPVEEVWSAMHDEKTRESHILLDGTKRDENGYFGVGILLHPLKCPADPDGDPEEIYNCRCRSSIVLQGIDHSKDDDLYEQFMKENEPDSWTKVKEVTDAKEAAFQANKEKAVSPIERQKITEAKGSEGKEKEEKPVEKQADTNPDNLPASTIEVIGEKGDPIPPETLAETVNPHYLEAGYTDNCQRCVVGYELGRRGYDVEAMAFDGSYLTTQSVFDISTQFRSGESFGTYITGEKYNPRNAQDKYPFNQSPKTTANSVVRAMTDWGDGARATMEVSWRQGGGSHVVNVENIGGVVKIIDAQSGMIFDNVEGYLSRTKCAETELRRTDILAIRNNIPQDILERICKKRG